MENSFKKLNSKPEVILGIDPGIERLGIAILKIDPLAKTKEELVFSECFNTSKNEPHADRLSKINEHIITIINKYSPTVIAIEKLFFTVNKKTALMVAEARGAVLCAIGQKNIKVIELSPTEIKQAVAGYGRATKADIIKMVPKIISMPTKSMQDDEIDAIAVALSASGYLRYSQY